MHDHHAPFYPFLFFALAVLFVVVSFLSFTPRLTGQVAVQAGGGAMVSLDLQVPRAASSWLGVYGNLSPSAADVPLSLAGGQVVRVDVRYDEVLTDETVIVASSSPDPDWSSVLPATLAEVDSFLGVASGDPQSAAATLSGRANFTIGGVTYEAWAATVRSVSGSYVTGAFSSNGDLLLITSPVAGGLGFSGEPVDYELLLPLPDGGASYSFFVFEQSSPPSLVPLSCEVQVNLSAALWSDDSSVLLTWDSVPGAERYEVLHLDGPQAGLLNFSSASMVSAGTGTSWVDTAPGAERYYRLRAVGSLDSCLFPDAAGTIALGLSPEYNLVSTPFVSADDSVRETLRSIEGSYSEVLVLDNLNKQFDFYIVSGQSVFKNFDSLVTGKGYWVRVASDETLRLVGVLEGDVVEAVPPDYSLVGFPVISGPAGDSSVEHVFSSVDGHFSEVLVLDNDDKVYDYYIRVGQSVFQSFDSVFAGPAYWLRTSDDAVLSYSSEVFP